MTDNHVITRDPEIVEQDPEANTVTFQTQGGEEVVLSRDTTVEGYGDHYFSGTVEEVQYDSDGDHHWIHFTDVTLGEEDVSEHTLPLGELADQIHENDLIVE